MSINKVKASLYCALAIVAATMFLFTINYIGSSYSTPEAPSAITAFNA